MAKKNVSRSKSEDRRGVAKPTPKPAAIKLVKPGVAPVLDSHPGTAPGADVIHYRGNVALKSFFGVGDTGGAGGGLALAP